MIFAQVNCTEVNEVYRFSTRRLALISGLFGILLLGACRRTPAPSPTPPPSDTPTASVTMSLPTATPSVQPTPTAAQSPTAAFKARSILTRFHLGPALPRWVGIRPRTVDPGSQLCLPGSHRRRTERPTLHPTLRRAAAPSVPTARPGPAARAGSLRHPPLVRGTRLRVQPHRSR